jgi:hypothetical protein
MESFLSAVPSRAGRFCSTIGGMRRMLLAVVLVTACGAPQGVSNGPGKTGSSDSTVEECHDEDVTGSNIPRRVCRTKFQSDLNRRGAQDWQLQPQNRPIKH